MIAIAYLKQKCSFSRGVREVLAKYGIEYEERQIHIPEYFKEMVEKTGQKSQPCVQLDDDMLVEVDGGDLIDYLDDKGFENNGSNPRIPIRDTSFRGF